MFPYQSIKVDFLMPQSRKVDLIRFRDSEFLALKASLLVYFHITLYRCQCLIML